ncbi:MAG: SnoaL-like domain-containing protein [Hamadaea sp.]|uniref:YybH family protein n=1 Tax=Hamadaea sp. TaxID=2024425 RepID=UPI0017A7EE19|nr:nuclear transport factor 2 family protein [Hamadaea sp.]NUT18829.1 SnoaL-like domain-containing protein [Hamadaea sp.]
MTLAQTPQQLHELFLEGVNNSDVDALLDLYEVDSLTVNLDGSRVHGEAALRTMLTEFVTAVDKLEGGTRKVVAHGDIALMSATFSGNGGAVAGITGEIARRQPDGGWRFLIDDPTFGVVSS